MKKIFLFLSLLSCLAASNPRLTIMHDTNTYSVYPTNLNFNTVGITNVSNKKQFFDTNNPSWINIKWYGAKGDGVTDDTISISNTLAAATAGQTVLFPPGIYKMSTVYPNNVYIYGPGATIFGISITNIANSRVSYGTAGGTPTNVAKFCPPFLLYRGSNVVVDGLVFTNDITANFYGGAQAGINTFHFENAEIKNCNFTSTNGLSVIISASKDVNIHDCNFNNTTFITGQGNKFNDTIGLDVTYDSTTTYGQDNLTVRDSKFNGTNTLVRDVFLLSSTTSATIENITFQDIQSQRSIFDLYSGDRGMHYYDGRICTNAVWVINNIKFLGTNNFYGYILSGLFRARGYSGSPDSTLGREDSLKFYTAYGSRISNISIENGYGYYMFVFNIDGISLDHLNMSANSGLIAFENGHNTDFNLSDFTLKRTGPGISIFTGVSTNLNSGLLFGVGGTATNDNWTIKNGSFYGCTADAQMLWQPTLAFNNLTLQNINWYNNSTNLAGNVDPVFRLTYSNKLSIINNNFYLLSTNYYDTNTFSIVTTDSQANLYFNYNTIIATNGMPVYAGIFQGRKGKFNNNNIGGSRYRFTESLILEDNNAYYSGTNNAVLQIEDTPITVMRGNHFEQTGTLGISQGGVLFTSGTTSNITSSGDIFIGTNNIHTLWISVGSLTLNGQVKATNTGSGDIYYGRIWQYLNLNTPLEIKKPGSNQAIFQLSSDSGGYGGSDDNIIFNNYNTNGVVGGFIFNNWTGDSNVFAFGDNPLPGGSRQFEIGGGRTKINGVTYTWPTNQTGGSLTNDGSGILSWGLVSGSGGSSSVYVNGAAVTNPNLLDSATATLGTSATTNITVNVTNITVSLGGTGAKTLTGVVRGSGTSALTASEMSGDITTTGSNAATIAASAVTLAKMANITTDSIIGRATAGTGAPEVLTALPFADTGDVTRPVDSVATTIVAGVVTNTKLADVATATVKGRTTAGTGVPTDLTTLPWADTGDITRPANSVVTTLKNTGTAGTYTKTTFDAQGRETSGTATILASSDFANQGTTTTLLHGNGAGNPSFGAVSLTADVSGVLPSANGGAIAGTMISSGSWASGTVPKTSDITGTNLIASAITVTGTNATLTGNLTANGISFPTTASAPSIYATDSTGTGMGRSTAGGECLYLSVVGSPYINLISSVVNVRTALDLGTSDDFYMARISSGLARLTTANGGTGIGSWEQGLKVQPKTTSYSVLSTDSHTVLTTTGASGTIVFTLPTAAINLEYYFYNDVAQIMQVMAVGSDLFQWGTYTSGAAKTFATATKGHHCHIYCDKALLWVIENASDAWTLDSLARHGNAVLVGGTATVSNAMVSVNTGVFLSRKTAGGTLGAGGYTYTLSAGTSFTIQSDDLTGALAALDTSTITWKIEELQ